MNENDAGPGVRARPHAFNALVRYLSAMRSAALLAVAAIISSQVSRPQPEYDAASLFCEPFQAKVHVAKPEPVKVNNLEEIRLQVTMMYTPAGDWVPNDHTRLDLVDDQGCPDCKNVRAPNVAVHVFRVEGDRRLPVPFGVSTSGMAFAFGKSRADYHDDVTTYFDVNLADTEATRVRTGSSRCCAAAE